jgi:hypothetical protein
VKLLGERSVSDVGKHGIGCQSESLGEPFTVGPGTLRRGRLDFGGIAGFVAGIV